MVTEVNISITGLVFYLLQVDEVEELYGRLVAVVVEGLGEC